LRATEAPQLIQLHLGDLNFTEQILVNFGRFFRRPAQPLEGRLFGHPERKADAGQFDFAEQELEHEDHFLFRRAEVEEDRLARLGELLPAHTAIKDAPRTALGLIGGDGSHVPAMHQSIMGAGRVGTRLVPVFGFSQGSVLLLVWSRNLNYSGRMDPFLFQSISG
jgi:hypothetical protein